MKLKFNRTVKHNGRLYQAGNVYEFDGELEADVQALTEIVHTDVHTKTSEADEERVETVPVAEVAPENAEAKPQPPELPKTAPIQMPRINA